MTQPCGNVLGRAERNFRFYSRASPIVCVADVVHFLMGMALGLSLDHRTPAPNFKFELHRRFSSAGDGGNGGGDGFSSMERTRVTRWVLLTVSGVPARP